LSYRDLLLSDIVDLDRLLRFLLLVNLSLFDKAMVSCQIWAHDEFFALWVCNGTWLGPSLNVAVLQSVNLHRASLLLLFGFLHVFYDLRVSGRLYFLHGLLLFVDNRIIEVFLH